MALYTLEALADDVKVMAIWWKRVITPSGGGISWDQSPLYLNTGDVEQFVSKVGKVNNVANPPLPKTVGESTVIAGVLRVTRISAAERPRDSDFD